MNNFEAVMRVYDVLEKLRITQKIQTRLSEEYGADIANSYFEGSSVEIPVPNIWIAGRKFELDRTWFLKKIGN
jgi:hypothetical protein